MAKRAGFSVILLIVITSCVSGQTRWRQLDAPYGGYITTIVTSADLGIIVGTTDAGLRRTTDGGSHWTILPFPGGTISSIVQAPGATLYATSVSGPVWRSKDSCKTWQSASGGITGKTIGHLAINSSGTLFASALDGVYRSTDQGTNWSAITTGLGAQRVVQIAVSPEDHLFAATYRSGVYRSYDGGNSWLSVSSSLGSGKGRSIAMDRYRVVYLGTESDGLFSTGDDGNSWNHLVSAGTFPAIGFDHESQIVTLDDHGILSRSTDSGIHWKTLSLDNLTYVVSAFSFDHSGVLYGGTKGSGVFKATNGVNGWQRIGLAATSVESMLPLAGGRILAGTTNGFLIDGGLWMTSDNGSSWQSGFLDNIQVRTIADGSNGHILCASSDAIYSADSNATTWKQLTFGNPPGSLTAVVQLQNGDQFAGVLNRGAYRYSRGGAQWIYAGLDSSTIYGFTKLPDGIILAATDRGLLRSTNEVDWDTTNMLPDARKITALRSEGNNLLAGGDSMIFRSTDSGQHWIRATIDGMPFLPGSLNAFSESHSPVVFAATSHGAYRSDDGGSTWFQYGTELESIDVQDIAFASNNYVYAGTAGNGIFISSGIINGAREFNSTAVLPKEIRMEPNYPNPFNPSTTLRYSLPVDERIRLEIYSVLGEKVATIAEGYSKAGMHSAVWNAEGVSSGVYVAVLSGEGFRVTRKLVLIR